MKKFFALALALIMVLSLVACGGSKKEETKTESTTTETTTESTGAEYTILFASNSSADPENPQNVGCNKFVELVEERSGGRIDVEYHGQAALGGAREIVEGVQLGTIHMGDVENGPMDSFVPAAAVWNLPYLFTSLEEVHAIQASDIGTGIQEGFEAVGIKHLAYNDGGFRYFTNSKHVIDDPSDFQV